MMYIASDKERCVVLATYLVENRATIRAAASRFGISKSTVHKDVTEALRAVDPALHGEVLRVLDVNKRERHLRGGEATRRKYLSENAGRPRPDHAAQTCHGGRTCQTAQTGAASSPAGTSSSPVTGSSNQKVEPSPGADSTP